MITQQFTNETNAREGRRTVSARQCVRRHLNEKSQEVTKERKREKMSIQAVTTMQMTTTVFDFLSFTWAHDQESHMGAKRQQTCGLTRKLDK